MAQLENLKTRLNITDSAQDMLLNAYLSDAESVILNRLYPFDNDSQVLAPKYYSLQVRVAEYLYLKQGAEGEMIHNENGINRHYESASVPESLLMELTPFAKVG